MRFPGLTDGIPAVLFNFLGALLQSKRLYDHFEDAIADHDISCDTKEKSRRIDPLLSIFAVYLIQYLLCYIIIIL